MEEDAQQPSPGNFIAWMNRNKREDDRKPVFTGEITLPEEAGKRPIALWVTVSNKTQKTMLTGRANRSAQDQIAKYAGKSREEGGGPEAPEVSRDDEFGPEPEAVDEPANELDMDVKPNDIVLFTNPQRDRDHQSRPDYFGYFNPGEGQQVMRLSVWARTDRGGNAMLSGSVVPFERALDRDAERDAPVIEGNQQRDQQREKRRSRGR